jgi:hypothetical protein
MKWNRFESQRTVFFYFGIITDRKKLLDMFCNGGDKYNIGGTNISADLTVINGNTYSIDICNATRILEKLHKEFTEKYTTTTGLTAVDSNKTTPSYYLRKQPTSNSDGGEINRSYNILTNTKDFNDQNTYRKMVSVIMKGTDDTTEAFDTIPASLENVTTFEDGTKFKGIYGLNKVVELLDKKIYDVLSGLTPAISVNNVSGNDIKNYNNRKEIKNTLEEIAYRENQIYREKFLKIILILVGIFLVASQLVNKYFGDGGIGSGVGSSGGAGLGGLFGFGFGGSGGLFSRFGGLGLGSSGRSHFDIGNLFKKSSYTLQQRN